MMPPLTAPLEIPRQKPLDQEMQVIFAVSVVIIVLVLGLTSHSFAEVPVLLLTFGAAALLNMGTNFLLGEISFVSDSVTMVLQLALAIDYADYSASSLFRGPSAYTG